MPVLVLVLVVVLLLGSGRNSPATTTTQVESPREPEQQQGARGPITKDGPRQGDGEDGPRLEPAVHELMPRLCCRRPSSSSYAWEQSSGGDDDCTALRPSMRGPGSCRTLGSRTHVIDALFSAPRLPSFPVYFPFPLPTPPSRRPAFDEGVGVL